MNKGVESKVSIAVDQSVNLFLGGNTFGMFR